MATVFIMLVVINLAVFSACSGDPDDNNPSIDFEENMPDDEAWSFEVTLTTDGIKTAEVRSGHMAHYEARNEYNLSDSVIADFYDQGKHTSQLTAETATINVDTNELIARKNVVVESDSGFVLYTEELSWDNEKELIYTDAFVTMITKDDTLYGNGFESNRSLKNYKIFNPTGKLSLIK